MRPDTSIFTFAAVATFNFAFIGPAYSTSQPKLHALVAGTPALTAPAPATPSRTRSAQAASRSNSGAGKSKSAIKTKRKQLSTRWSKSAQIAAQARCKQLLSGLDVIVEPILPIRRNACGDAAPVRLIAIGSNPRVTLSPAPIVNCQMVAAMHKWLTRDLQPMARKYLKSPLKQLGIMSSYSCRTAYGKRGNKLSQHGRANALDIRNFVTVAGSRTALLANWGPRRRYKDKAPNVITAHSPPDRAPAMRRKSSKAGGTSGWTTSINTPSAGGYNSDIATADITASPPSGATALSLLKSIFSSKDSSNHSFGYNNEPAAELFSQRSRLGAPKRKAGPRLRKSEFLREVHRRACTIFGTVLGPDANYIHRNHFHIDLQKRKSGPFCR